MKMSYSVLPPKLNKLVEIIGPKKELVKIVGKKKKKKKLKLMFMEISCLVLDCMGMYIDYMLQFDFFETNFFFLYEAKLDLV